MHTQAMNHYGNNRGFGGPPQPQRQGGRRGNNRGAFRGPSRFDQNNQNQRNQNQQQGGQRPNIESPKQAPQAEKTQQSPQAAQQQQQRPPQQPNPQQRPQQQQAPPAQQAPATTPQKPDTPAPAQPKPANTPNKPAVADVVDTVIIDDDPPAKPANQNQQKNINGNFGGNQQGGWQGGNKQGGNFQQGQNQGQGGNFGQGNKPFGQDQGQGNKPFGPNQGQGNKPFGQNQGQGNKPFGQNQGPDNNKPFGQNQGPDNNKPFGQNQGGQGNKPFGQNQGGQGNKPFGQNQGGQGKPFGQNQGGPGNKPFNQNQGGPGGQGGFQKQGGPGGPARNQQRQSRGPMLDRDGKPAQREEQMLANKLKDLVGPLVDLPPLEQGESKFNGRSRLYIGNFTSDMTEEEILALFAPYGETSELFLNKEKNFGFIKVDYRVNAEKAKRELDGKMRNGRTLRVRFAPHNSAVRVKNLPPFVSNELLYRAFEIFGKIERAYVKVDERGKSIGEGVVEYARKPSALAAIRNCTERCFFLTSSLRPVIVESFEEPDEFDGYPEKNLPKKHPDFLRAREYGPRFSEANSFEHEYGTRWKQLHELHRQKEEALKKELAAEEEKLEAQMEYAKYEHETELLREQLRQREQDRERQKRSWELAERAADERREHERELLQRQEDDLAQRMRHQDDELRRRQQENTLFVQAQRLNSMLDRQEQGMFDQQQPMDGGYREQFDMPPRGGYDDMPAGRGWDNQRQMDDFPNKRRRF